MSGHFWRLLQGSAVAGADFSSCCLRGSFRGEACYESPRNSVTYVTYARACWEVRDVDAGSASR